MLGAIALAYSFITVIAIYASRRASGAAAGFTPAVSILKPLCGVDVHTYECLKSFCDQQYPQFEVIFGIADPEDPVLAVAERLQREYPHRNVRLVVDGRQHGSSRKISNLLNMVPHAGHEFLVLADCDVRAAPDYLGKVIAPLIDPGVGIVTCCYRGVSRSGLWSMLECIYINEWFIPSVQVAALGGSRSFAFGASIAIKRSVLGDVGGFSAIANQLADDYRLGELTRDLGLRTVLSSEFVDILVAKRTLGELVRHQIRWLCTIKAVRPYAFGFCFITFPVPIALLAAWLARGAPLALSMLLMILTARTILHWQTRRDGAGAFELVLALMNDTLSLGLWGWSLLTRRVSWRDAEFLIAKDGSSELIVRSTP